MPAGTPQAERVFSLLRAGRAGDAIVAARALVAEAPSSPQAHHAQALALAAGGDDIAADASFRRALVLAPRDAAILANHAVSLRRAGHLDAATLQLRTLVDAHPLHAPGWVELGRTLLRAGDASAACEALERALAIDATSAVGWHLLGNAARDAERLEDAERAFRASIALDPRPWTAWFNLAAVLRLAGRPDEAIAIHSDLMRRGHATPALLDAYAGALTDAGDVEAALVTARETVRAHPEHVPAHVTLAHLLWEHGEEPAEAIACFRAAVEARPDDLELRAGFARWLIASGHPDEAVDHARESRRRADDPALVALEADALEAAGRSVEAGALYRHLHASGGALRIGVLNAYARHLLRTGDPQGAARIATEATTLDPRSQEAWAYLGTAWRLLGDAREAWLCDAEQLVGVLDIGFPVDHERGREQVRATLETLHRARREPRQQSVRGGTQTAGRLLQRQDPVLAAMRSHLLDAVRRWLATLPVVPGHPFLERNTRAVTLGGSWSVRLASAGAHTDHIHPEGWISSAFYVALPASVTEDATGGGPGPGHLRFGQPPAELGLDLPARRIVQPREGRLVLFPSYFWHGTEPFHDAQPRLTIAFDMTPADEHRARA